MEEAARWRVRQAQGLNPLQAAEFEQWMAQPGHAAAFEQVSKAWDITGRASVAQIEQLRASVSAYTTRRRRMSAGLRAAAAAAVVACVGGGIYFTQTGQRFNNVEASPRTVVLGDGSRVTLDTGTKLQVRYRASARELSLVTGQATFEVAHDLQRPFRVHAGGITVTARGTVFNIDTWSHGATVELLQGRVDVERGETWFSGPRQQTELSPGQEITVEYGQLSKAVPGDMEAATAWRRGAIVLNNVSLARAVERVNRYGGARIVLDQPAALANLRVSGVFQMGRPEAFAQSVAHLYSLKVDYSGGRILIEPSGG